MARIEAWTKALVEHVRRAGKVHVIGVVAVSAGMAAFGLALLALYVLLFGSSLLFAALEQEDLALLSFFGIGALGSLTVLALHLLAFGLWLGWLRAALLAGRGQAVGPGELAFAFRHPLRCVGLALLCLVALVLSAGLFYLPLIFLGPWLVLTATEVAEGRAGLLTASGEGWRRAGRAYGELLLVSLVGCAVVGFSFVLPLAGPGLAVALATASAVVAHESLPRGAPAGG